MLLYFESEKCLYWFNRSQGNENIAELLSFIFLLINSLNKSILKLSLMLYEPGYPLRMFMKLAGTTPWCEPSPRLLGRRMCGGIEF